MLDQRNQSQVFGQSSLADSSAFSSELAEKAKAYQIQNKELKSMLIEKENELNRVRKEN